MVVGKQAQFGLFDKEVYPFGREFADVHLAVKLLQAVLFGKVGDNRLVHGVDKVVMVGEEFDYQRQRCGGLHARRSLPEIN